MSAKQQNGYKRKPERIKSWGIKNMAKNKGENIDKRMVANDPFSPREVTMRRQPCVNQEAGPHQTPDLPAA